MQEPNHKVTILKELYNSGPGFLTLRRANVQFSYEDSNDIKEMVIDYIDRKICDAVVIIPWFVENNKTYIVLRSSIRSQFMFKDFAVSERYERSNIGNFWELPAGLIEENEVGESGVINAAKRELLEEVGVDLPIDNLTSLGPRRYSSVGLLPERLYFISANFKKEQMKQPTLDGSPMELHGKLWPVELNSIVDQINDGSIIVDTKTEIGIMRLYNDIKRLDSKTK